MKLTDEEKNILEPVSEEMLYNEKPQNFCVITINRDTNNIVVVEEFTHFRKNVKEIPYIYDDLCFYKYILKYLR